MLLEIKNLNLKIKNKQILKNMNLSMPQGQIHVIMGPNGTGKSTLANILIGRPDYNIQSGKIVFDKKDITNISMYERACLGMFLTYQYPIEINGVGNSQFLRSSLNSIRKYHNLNEIDSVEFLKKIKSYMKILNMNLEHLHRSVNNGFSGGEKKKNEILQMMMLNPKLCIFDEIDSGLDIDSLKLVANTIKKFHNKEKSFIIITHYQRLLDYISPDIVHILHDGRIIKSGTKSLAKEIEKHGYSWIK